MLERIVLTVCVVTSALALPAAAGEERAPNADADKTMTKLSRLVGGTWVSVDPKFVVEFRYEWAFGKTAIRGLGVIGKGSSHEQLGEAIMGSDPVNKTVYYLDCHGGNQVFKGTVKQEGDDLVFEFATVVGAPARWREVLRFTDEDTMQFTIFGEKAGEWVPVVKQTSKRKHPETRPDQVVTEGVIEAPVESVWAAFTTKKGQESWNVAHAEIDLKVGGLMRTHYDPKGRIGDPQTIENTILAFEPNRMLAIQVKNPPARFPFQDAIRKMWTVIHFEDAGPSRTRMRIVGIGYGDDDESRKLRSFFDKGNTYTLKKLQERFAGKPKPPAS
jgi:uncharacterized protein YndB with AHSA1/START domain